MFVFCLFVLFLTPNLEQGAAKKVYVQNRFCPILVRLHTSTSISSAPTHFPHNAGYASIVSYSYALFKEGCFYASNVNILHNVNSVLVPHLFTPLKRDGQIRQKNFSDIESIGNERIRTFHFFGCNPYSLPHWTTISIRFFFFFFSYSAYQQTCSFVFF